MFRARERGMSFWPFAVTLLGMAVFVFLWFGATAERDQHQQSAKKADDLRKSAEADKAVAIEKLAKVSKLVGFQSGGNMTDPDAMEAQMKEYADKLRETMKLTFPISRYTADSNGGQVEKTEGGVVTVAYLTESELQDIPTYQAYLSKFELAARRMKSDIERSFASTESFGTEKTTVTASYEATIKEKDRVIAQLTGEKAALDSQMREKETELKDTIAQVTSQKDAKETELESHRKQTTDNEAKLLAQLRDLNQTISTLVQRDAPAKSEGPDGEVITASDGVAIINRGRTHMLMPGTIFDVWGVAKGGAKYLKGSIEITSCDSETARGAIVKEDTRNPIQKGDLIQSLAYSPNRVLHFALVGDFKKMGRTQAEAVLTRLAAKVDPKVTAETNYLVVGVPGTGQESLDDTEAVKAAKELGIRMITEEDLSLFTRY